MGRHADVERIAACQHSLITHRQAAAFLTDREIATQREIGRWVLLMRGVYRLAGAPVTPLQTALAACLGGPPGTRASHVTSLALRNLWQSSMLPHVTVSRSQSARLPLARVHRSDVDRLDRAVHLGIPCTSVARAIVESAAMLGRGGIVRVVDDAIDRKLTTVRAIDAAGERSGTRRGNPSLDAAVDPWRDDIRPGSPAEIRLLRLVRSWGYPTPEKQIEIRDENGVLVAIADLGWPSRKVGLEYDSTRFHNPRRWEHDEVRHEAVEVLGYRLIHADKTDLMPGERSLRDQLRRAWAT